MTTRIKLRRDTAANWLAANPILAAGEPGLETDTGKIKYGDGVTAYANLPHAGGDTLNDEGGVTVTAGSTKYWLAAQRRESKDVYGRGVRHDSLGNVYTLTETQDDADTVSVITKYSPTGTLLWQHTIDQAQPCALAVDSGDNTYVALEGNDDLAHLIKFADDGEIVWKKEYDAGTWQGEAFIEERTSTRLVMTLNREDNVADRVLVLDINTSTGEIATQKILTAGTNNLYAAGIDTDSNGNVFVSGRYRDGDVGKDKMFVEKLNGSLDRVWSKSLETSNEYNMSAGDCASDAQGNVYAVGFYDVDTVNPDSANTDQTAGVLVKLNSAGVVQWTRRLGPGPCGQSVVGLTATDVGEVYLVSQTLEFKRDKQLDDFAQFAEGTNRMIVAKYDTAGAVIWQRYIDASHVWENNDEFRGQTVSVFDDKFVVDFYGNSSNTIPWNFSGTDDNEADYFLVQLPADGTGMTIGDVDFRESRIPGRFVTHSTTASPTLNEVFEDTITVATSNLTLDPASRVANVTVKSETYDYVFGPDGTLTIPNDGDVRLTQNQMGFFSVIGDTVNYNYDTQGRAVTADSQGNTYVVGEDDDSGKPIVVKISPEGYRVWSVAINEDNTNPNGRANGLALHPANGNVYVICEFYGNYTYGALVVIDQDTGRILDYTDYTDTDNDVYLNDIVFQSDNAYVIGGSKNGNFKDQGPFEGITGSATQKLVIPRSAVSGTPDTNWQIGGSGFSVFENIAAIEQYSNLTGTTDAGSGAVFTVEKTGGFVVDATVTAGQNGINFITTVTRGDQVDSYPPMTSYFQFGVTGPNEPPTPAALTAITTGSTIRAYDESNQLVTNTIATTIGPVFWVQSAGSFYIPVTWTNGQAYLGMSGGTKIEVGSGSGSASYSVLITNGGTNYKVGHKVKISGTSLGGATPANDITITVDAVNSGVITSVSNSGTPTGSSATYTGLSGTNLIGNGFAFLSFSGPLISSNYSDRQTFIIDNSGINYVLGDVVRISGTQLGGTSPANDLIVTVTNVGSNGELYDFTLSGTAQTTNWNIITTTNVDFSGEGSWTLTVPLSRENLLIGDGFKRLYGTNTGSYTDRTYAIAVDEDDNIIAATQGYGQVSPGNNYDLAVVYKFNSTGTLQWARQLNERNDSYCEGKGITTIGTDIYVTHYSGYNGQTVITKLDSSGTVKWQRLVDSGSDSSISADKDGNLVVVVEAYNNDIGDDAIKLFKLTANGETIYKRWLFATTQNDTRFKNGRCLAVEGDSIHITSYYYADDYDSWFVARLPLDGSGTGEYSQFRYMDTVPMTGSWNYSGLSNDTNYQIGEVGGSLAGALTVAPYVNNTVSSITTVGRDLYVNTYYPSYFWEEILDQDGGNIVFADGTTQNTSATDTPQRLYTGARYTLGMRDRGHHIYCTEQNNNILIPYDARVPFPIGTTIVIVNNTGSSMYIGTEGGGTGLLVEGYGNAGGAELSSNGVATLMKVEREQWVIYGNNLNPW